MSAPASSQYRTTVAGACRAISDAATPPSDVLVAGGEIRERIEMVYTNEALAFVSSVGVVLVCARVGV